jgi:glycosyltransferase involved in cell wall biosynthesis
MAASTVGAALASVASQSVPAAEVVVVDDGSSDATAEIAAQWSSVLPLTIVRQSNAGPAAARRRAMADITAPLVALLDADDIWLPDHLSSLVDAYQRQSGGIVSANALSWRPGEGVSARSWQERFPVPPPDEQRRRILLGNFVFVGALLNVDDARAVGGFRDGFSGAEDWDLWIRMVRAGVVVHPSRPATVLYRTSGAGLTAGAGIHGVYIAVLERARQETTDDGERTAIDRRLRWHHARRHLADAYVAAQNGQLWNARAEALRASMGSIPMAAQATGLMAAPAHVARWGARLRSQHR